METETDKQANIHVHKHKHASVCTHTNTHIPTKTKHMRIMEPARWKGSWMDVLLTRSGSATMKKNVIGSCGMSVKSQKPVSCGTCSRDREGERKRKEARE